MKCQFRENFYHSQNQQLNEHYEIKRGIYFAIMQNINTFDEQLKQKCSE